jgi:transcriptional regulator with XRE-family HTH domain
VKPGQLIRETRLRHGLSQARLALRAGTRQSAISRLEKDEVSPSLETLEHLMNAMGESVRLDSGRLAGRFDPLHLEASGRRSPGERLALAISWNRTAAEMAEAGRRARQGSPSEGSDA